MNSFLALLAVSFSQSSETVSTTGVYKSPNGVQLELLGIASYSPSEGLVYGADGEPLGKDKVAAFIRYSGKKGYGRPSKSKEEEGGWMAIFIVRGNKEDVDGVKPTFSQDFAMITSSRPDMAKGKPDNTITVALRVKKGQPYLDYKFTFSGGPFAKIADFGSDGSTDANGFEFKLEAGTTTAFKATRQKREQFSMDAYLGNALIPLSHRGSEFKLEASDQKTKIRSKQDVDDFMSAGVAVAVEKGMKGDKLKLEIMARLPHVPSRRFSLYARSQQAVTLRINIPKV